MIDRREHPQPVSQNIEPPKYHPKLITFIGVSFSFLVAVNLGYGLLIAARPHLVEDLKNFIESSGIGK